MEKYNKSNQRIILIQFEVVILKSTNSMWIFK